MDTIITPDARPQESETTRERLALAMYADPDNWGHGGTIDVCQDLWMPTGHGYDVAQEALGGSEVVQVYLGAMANTLMAVMEVLDATGSPWANLQEQAAWMREQPNIALPGELLARLAELTNQVMSNAMDRMAQDGEQSGQAPAHD